MSDKKLTPAQAIEEIRKSISQECSSIKCRECFGFFGEILDEILSRVSEEAPTCEHSGVQAAVHKARGACTPPVKLGGQEAEPQVCRRCSKLAESLTESARKKVRKARNLLQAIDLFLEYRDKYGYDDNWAKAKVLCELMDAFQ